MGWEQGNRLRAIARRRRPDALAFVLCACAAMLIAVPVTWQRAVEDVRFTDRLGTFPVRVSLCQNGRSTLDTGLFGKVYWDRSGRHGFSAYARAIGPPEAGGDLASYVDPDFVQANVVLIDDPDVVVRTYSARFADGLRDRVLRDELLIGLFGGTMLFLIVPRDRLRRAPRAQGVAAILLLVAGATAISTFTAVQLQRAWPCAHRSGDNYAMPDVSRLSFSSPQTREVAQQVKPFIDKNLDRISAEAKQFEKAAAESLTQQIDAQRGQLMPRPGEKLIAAEADTQGSFVGVRVRTKLYAALTEALGPEAIAMRTISGDVSSNGTIAESDYIAHEARVSPGIPVVAAGGDHDSPNTWQQLEANDVLLPDFKRTTIAGIRVIAANDRERKTLFGGIVTNPSGVSEQELGQRLRASQGRTLPSKPSIALVHQPDAAAGYLDLLELGKVRNVEDSPTTPRDDGIPDQPPGIVNVGHLHQKGGPWVLWNTDGDRITWTVVNQLGTSGGVENRPTFNRFSTPNSAPLEPLAVRLEYVNRKSGLQTGYVDIDCATDGACAISDRVEVGLPGGEPEVVETPALSPSPSAQILCRKATPTSTAVPTASPDGC
jgi:hypothetical protein